MSLVSHIQSIIDNIEEYDYKILQYIESRMKYYQYVPIEVIEKGLKLPPGILYRSLSKLTEMKLIRRRVGSIVGYTLNYTGLDVLALKTLIRRGVIDSVGEKIGVGKESDVYIVRLTSGSLAVAKLHREGRTSFRKIKRYRGPIVNVNRKHWYYIAKLLGEREFKILAELKAYNANVPKPIAYNRNCIVQEYIEGVELYRNINIDNDLALKILRDVIDTLRIAYTRIGIVHGDLSEYNIIVNINENSGFIIDWPQYVYIDDDNAEYLLERDIKYILRFFKKRYNIILDYENVKKYIKGDINVI